MEQNWKLTVDGGFNFKLTRGAGVVRMECSREAPGIFVHSTTVLTLKQSKQIEEIFRAANRAAAGEET